MAPEKTAFEVAVQQFDIAAEALDLEESIRNKLRLPKTCLSVNAARFNVYNVHRDALDPGMSAFLKRCPLQT